MNETYGLSSQLSSFSSPVQTLSLGSFPDGLTTHSKSKGFRKRSICCSHVTDAENLKDKRNLGILPSSEAASACACTDIINCSDNKRVLYSCLFASCFFFFFFFKLLFQLYRQRNQSIQTGIGRLQGQSQQMIHTHNNNANN